MANPLSFSHKETSQDIQRLQNLLSGLKEKHLQHLSKKDHIDILTLACGRADETGALANVFLQAEQSGQIIGADIRDREIGEANERWNGRIGSKIDAEFLVQDGTKLDEVKSIGQSDITLLRHQNYWNGDRTWEEIFDQALAKMKDDGHLIITSYFDREHSQAIQALQRQGGVLIDNIHNDISRKVFDGPNKSVDRHIAVFRKKC